MPEPLVIALTAWKRPHYLRQVLAGLAGCAGIADCVFLPHVEPGCAETRDLIEGFAACETRPTWNFTRLGVNPNTAAACRAGFARASYVIFLEDDCVPAPDFLAYHRWASARYRDDPAVGSVAAYHRRATACPPAEHHTVRRRCWFHGSGCGLWRDRLAPHLDDLAASVGWDTFLNDYYLAGGWVEVYPELARVQNIGLTTTVQTDPQFDPAWYLAHHRLAHWAGTASVGAGKFAEVD